MYTEIDPQKFRLQVKQVSGKDITSEHAKHFLDMLHDDLEAELHRTLGAFIVRHFGKKGSPSEPRRTP